MPTSKVLGILGGLGPMATAYFYQLVIQHTKVYTDQDHIDMVISSKATTPDRTAFIIGKSRSDPFVVMEAEAHRLVTFGAEVLAIPCNTAHYFYTRLEAAIPIPVLNMVQLTASRLKKLGCAKVGILATDGTIQTQTYQRACKAEGLHCEIPSDTSQKNITSVIYNNIKAGIAPNMALFSTAAEELLSKGCEMLVLGCTELSLLKRDGLLQGPYLDSMDVLAEAAIITCGKNTINFN